MGAGPPCGCCDPPVCAAVERGAPAALPAAAAASLPPPCPPLPALSLHLRAVSARACACADCGRVGPRAVLERRAPAELLRRSSAPPLLVLRRCCSVAYDLGERARANCSGALRSPRLARSGTLRDGLSASAVLIAGRAALRFARRSRSTVPTLATSVTLTQSDAASSANAESVVEALIEQPLIRPQPNPGGAGTTGGSGGALGGMGSHVWCTCAEHGCASAERGCQVSA